MTIIIAGYLDFDPDQCPGVLTDVKDLIEATYDEPGCLHYRWGFDPLVPGRVLVFEEWENEEGLQHHFDNECYSRMGEHFQKIGIRGFDVKKYRVDLAEPVYDNDGVPRADFFSDPTRPGL